MNFTLIWEEALQNLEKQFKNTDSFFVFDTYIRFLKPQQEGNNTFYLLASDDIQKEMINERFFDVIKESVDNIINERYGTGYEIDLYIQTSKEVEKNIKREDDYSEKNMILNPYYTFENFIVGDSNRFAHAASMAVVDNPGTTYNPLFIYGGVGLGKTHLIQAIGNSILKKNPSAKIIYTTTESFINELIETIRRKTQEQFKRKYRSVDLFMMDDIQFIARSDSAKEELFHTFNTLHQAGKQIVISSDKPPAEIPNLEERLLSRFRWGILAKIDKPDYETRVAIRREKLPYIKQITHTDFDVDDEVLHYIASKNDANIRDLEGALKKVILQALLYSSDKNIKTIDISITEEALSDFFNDSSKKAITPKYIINTVCGYFDLSEDEITGKKKNKEVALPRQICMFFLRKECNIGFKAIGDMLGGRDHSTVMHACDKIKDHISTDIDIKNIVNDIEQRIRE